MLSNEPDVLLSLHVCSVQTLLPCHMLPLLLLLHQAAQQE